MKKLVEFQLDGVGTVVAEVEAPEPEGGREQVSRGDEVEKGIESFDAAVGKVKVVAQKLIGGLSDLLIQPDEISIELGIKLSAKTGVIIASADSEANFKISLTWKNKH